MQITSAAAAELVAVEEGVYEIISGVNDNMSLDISDASKNSGANVQQYYHNNTEAQKWQFRNAGNGYYYISAGNFALDVSGGGTQNGTNVQIYKPNFTASQKWKLKKVNSLSETSTFKEDPDYGSSCVVRINDSLINKKGKQNATVKLQTYAYHKTTNGKLVVTLQDMSGRVIWSGIKKGGDTIKLGDDYSAYKISVQRYDSGNGIFENGDDFINVGKTLYWGLTKCKNCSLYNVR